MTREWRPIDTHGNQHQGEIEKIGNWIVMTKFNARLKNRMCEGGETVNQERRDNDVDMFRSSLSIMEKFILFIDSPRPKPARVEVIIRSSTK